MELPTAVAALVDELASATGVQAVVPGGSRAIGTNDDTSDWDLGVFYRGDVDLAAMAARGDVHPPGSWGRIMNGGAWLTLDDHRVDVLLRDLAAVEHWTAEAAAGRFEIDGLPGYVAGIPTYSLTAEVAVSRVLAGVIGVDVDYPEALAVAGDARWRWNRDFSLYHAEANARRGNVAATLGQAARAVIEEAHARCCASRRWVLNEKYVVHAAGLDSASMVLLQPHDEHGLVEMVDTLRMLLVGDPFRAPSRRPRRG